VDEKAVRPSELFEVPSSSILALSEVPDPEAILAFLNQLIAGSD